jgi:hypothetical protein
MNKPLPREPYHTRDKEPASGRHTPKYLRWAALLLAFLCATIVTFYPTRTTFDVSTSTDRIRCATSNRTVRFRWVFEQADLEAGWDANAEKLEKATFEPANDVDIHFERVGHADVIVDCHAHEANASVGILSTASGHRQLPDKSVFRLHLESDKQLILVMAGEISVGNVLRPLSTNPSVAILHSGTVMPIGHSFLSDSRYETETTALDPGDEFTVDREGNSEGYGFIVIDDRPSMNATYRINGRTGRVDRFGGSGFNIDIPLLARIKHDSVVQGFWGAFVFLTGILISQKQKRAS